MSGKHWSKKEDADLKKRWAGPESIAIIAKAMGRTRDSVNKRGNALKLPKKVTFVGLQRGTDWTDDLNERLRKLWSEGKSANEIARMMSTKDRKITRNSVIGKVYRLDIARPAKSTLETQRVAAINRIKSPKAPLVHPSVFAKPRALVAAPVERPTLRTLGQGCKWPIGDVRRGWGEDQRFCGCAKELTQPYCVEHAKVAFTKQTGEQRASRWMRSAVRFG